MTPCEHRCRLSPPRLAMQDRPGFIVNRILVSPAGPGARGCRLWLATCCLHQAHLGVHQKHVPARARTGAASPLPVLSPTYMHTRTHHTLTTSHGTRPHAPPLQMPMVNEAFFALMEGVGTAHDIDTGMKLGTNQPMGPLTLAGGAPRGCPPCPAPLPPSISAHAQRASPSAPPTCRLHRPGHVPVDHEGAARQPGGGQVQVGLQACNVWVGGGGRSAVGCPVGLGWPLRWLLPCLLAPLTPALLFNVPAGPARCSCSTWMPAGWARRAGAGCTPTPDRMQRMWRCCCCVHYGARSHTRSNFLKNMLHLPGVAFLVLADDAFQPDAPAKFKWFSGAHGTPGPGGAEFRHACPLRNDFICRNFGVPSRGAEAAPLPLLAWLVPAPLWPLDTPHAASQWPESGRLLWRETQHPGSSAALPPPDPSFLAPPATGAPFKQSLKSQHPMMLLGTNTNMEFTCSPFNGHATADCPPRPSCCRRPTLLPSSAAAGATPPTCAAPRCSAGRKPH